MSGEQVHQHASVLSSVAPPTARPGMPEPVGYDPAARPHRAREAAREAEVEGLVAAAKAEAARRWEAAGRPSLAHQVRLPACRGRTCGAWRYSRCDTPCWEDQP